MCEEWNLQGQGVYLTSSFFALPSFYFAFPQSTAPARRALMLHKELPRGKSYSSREKLDISREEWVG
jgi:hypothetical protein